MNNPIIFIGSGRNGSTIIFEAISRHPKLGWLSNYNYLIKAFPQVGVAHRIFKQYGEKSQGQKLSIINNIYPRPLEVYTVWENLCGTKFRKSSLHNVIATKNEIENTTSYFERLISAQGKKRLAIKVTGPPRAHYLQSIFTDAIFINIVRHPVAVVNSYINVDFWNKKGISKPHWSDFFTDEDFLTWEKHERSKISLAALEWKRIFRLTQIELERKKYLQIKYEDFLSDPHESIKEILHYSNLDFPEKLSRYIDNKKYENKNYKVNNLNTEQIDAIQEICAEEIVDLGYSFISSK